MWSWEDSALAMPSEVETLEDKEMLGTESCGLIRPFCCLWGSILVSAPEPSRKLHALRSLFSIINARHFVTCVLLPKWPWAEPSKAPPFDDYPQFPPGRPLGWWLPATFRLGSGCWKQSPGPQRTPLVPVENGLEQSLGEWEAVTSPCPIPSLPQFRQRDVCSGTRGLLAFLGISLSFLSP